MNLINILATEFSGWCNEEGVRQAIHLVKSILEVLRIVVPIGLILMTTLDITKKVINPDEKDGQKKIMNRALAALIVFLLPTFIGLVFKIIDIGKNSGNAYEDSKSSIKACGWE